MLASPKRSAVISGSLHAAAIAIVLLATNPRTSPFVKPSSREPVYLVPLTPLPGRPSHAGGGGGTRENTPVRKGPPPRTSRTPFVPPAIHLIQFQPRLSMEPAIFDSPEATMPVPDFGVPNGVLGSVSGGPGKGGIAGGGCCGGIGDRNGPGAGDGSKPGISESRRLRGTIVNPVLLAKNEPEYSEEARRARLQGSVMLRIEVNERGQAQNIVVTQSLGLGLDERAVESVRQWRFRAGSVDGKPTPIAASVEVSFRLL